MKKMGITQDNLVQDNTRVSAAKGTSIKVWGFLPVILQVKDLKGMTKELNECMYFAKGVMTTLVSLGALKNLGCVSRNFPYDMETVSSLTDRDKRDDKEDEEKEEVIKPRGPTPRQTSQDSIPTSGREHPQA